MCRLRKRIEGLIECPPIEIALRLRVVFVAPHVDFVSAGAEQRRGNQLRDGAQQTHREIDRGGRGEAELSRGRLVRVRRPGRRAGARNVLRVRIGDSRGVSRCVDFL